MNMRNIKIISMFVAIILVFSACNKDDYTGYSKLTPTDPTITVAFGDVTSIPDAGNYTGETDSTITVNVSMDVAQIVDVAVFISVIDGNATEGEDFSLSANEIFIKAGETSTSFDITVIKDDLVESIETFTVQVGDQRTANANIVPVAAKFTIPNYTSDDIIFSLEWSTESVRYDEDGEELSATDIADMEYYLLDAGMTMLYAGSDGGGFEEFIAEAALIPDGDYVLYTEFYWAWDFGDTGGVDLDFVVGYNQPGIQNGTFEFKAALNSDDYFGGGYAVFCSVTKAGNIWTVAVMP